VTTSHVTVIGAGPGGLATALLLKAAGHSVTVLEARGEVGGRTSAHEADGFRFDNGPTFFLYPEVLESIFEAVGRNLRDEIELIRVDPLYRVQFGDGSRFDATDDIEELSRRIGEISPQDAAAVPRFFADNDRKLAAFIPFLQKPFLSTMDLLDPKLLATMPELAPWRQLEGELERYFVDPRVRMAFSFQALYLGMTPRSCPSLFSILPAIEYRYGVWHPRGGCSAVMETMARVAREIGVDIRLDEPVTGIEFTGRRARTVCTGRGRYASDAVVINGDFANTMRTLVPNRLRRRWTNARIDKQKFSCSTFMLYLGLDGTMDDQPHHTIYIPDDYNRHLDDIDAGQDMTPDPAFYAQNGCVTDRTLAPEGMSTLYMLMPVAHEQDASSIDWSRELPRYRQMALSQLARVGFDDVESRIRHERIATPATWREEFHVHKGATFNMAHNFGQMLTFRPRNRFEDLEGVYLVGGGTHPGSGLPTIFESARISVQLLNDDLGGAAVPTTGRDEQASLAPATAAYAASRATREASTMTGQQS